MESSVKRILLPIAVASLLLLQSAYAQDANELKISKAQEKIAKSKEKLKMLEANFGEADSLYTAAEEQKKRYEDTLSQLANEDKELQRDYFNASKQAQKEAREVRAEGLDSLRNEYRDVEKDFADQFKDLDRRFKQAYRGYDNSKRNIDKAKEKRSKAHADVKAAERGVRDAEKALEIVKKQLEKKQQEKAKREQKKDEERSRKNSEKAS
jgi:hypothetical protein